MLPKRSLTVVYGLCILFAKSQTTLDPALCLSNSGVTTFAACDYLYGQINYCAGPQVASGTAAVACYCNQKLFNAIFDCESEQRLCNGDDNNDGSFQTEINQWHSACDQKITFTPTTPVVSSLTASYDRGYCTTAYSACAQHSIIASQCSVSSTGGGQFSSCYCQPKMVSLQYTCLYLGNTSCLAEPAAVTALPAFSLCKNGPSLLSSINEIPAAASGSTTSSGTLSTQSSGSSSGASASSITRPTLPGTSNTGTATAQSTSTNSGGALINSGRAAGFLVGAFAIWEARWIKI